MNFKILAALNYSENTYQSLVFDSFLVWVSEKSYSDNHLQLLLTSNALFQWYLNEYKKNEKAFLFQAKAFIGRAPIADVRALYDDKVLRIHFYPKPILDKILKQAKMNAAKPFFNTPNKAIYTLN